MTPIKRVVLYLAVAIVEFYLIFTFFSSMFTISDAIVGAQFK